MSTFSSDVDGLRSERLLADGHVSDPTTSSDTLYRKHLKRLIDVLLALVVLPISLPVALVLCAAIARDGGNPIYASWRWGKGGRKFRCWKLRTMRSDSSEVLERCLREDPALRAYWYENFKLPDDPRITRLGAFLRKTSLDELPQVFNVLVGDMSFVGPRPILLDELEPYGPSITSYWQMTPGITGLWQVAGRDDLSYRDRVRYNDFYHRRISFRFDASILLRTALVVVRRRGAS